MNNDLDFTLPARKNEVQDLTIKKMPICPEKSLMSHARAAKKKSRYNWLTCLDTNLYEMILNSLSGVTSLDGLLLGDVDTGVVPLAVDTLVGTEG